MGAEPRSDQIEALERARDHYLAAEALVTSLKKKAKEQKEEVGLTRTAFVGEPGLCMRR
jgi:hypothetical protein